MWNNLPPVIGLEIRADPANSASLRKTPKDADLSILSTMLVYMYSTKAGGSLQGIKPRFMLTEKYMHCNTLSNLPGPNPNLLDCVSFNHIRLHY